MNGFPRAALELVADELVGINCPTIAAIVRQAIKAHDELSDRCVMDRTELSLQIANLRQRLQDVDPEFK